MPDTEYLKIQTDMGIENPVAFTKPAPPKVDDDAITIKRTEQRIVDCKAMESQLKKQVIAAIEREYIEALRDVKVGFARVTAKEIIKYVVDEYDIITYDELNTNREKLDATWDASEPIHKLWSRTLDIQRFATAGKMPIADVTIMHALITVLMKTGVFTTHITIWKQKPVNTWTMDTFKRFFNDADKERLLHTAKEAGYANAVKSTPTTNTKTDKGQANVESGNVNDKTYVTLGDRKIYYCWSHGGSTNANHTSQTCNRQKDGHVSKSNWMNTCGGCTDMLISAENKQYRFKNNYRNNSGGNRSGNATNNSTNNGTNNSNNNSNNNSDNNGNNSSNSNGNNNSN
jgi:hypothetical protein